MNSPQPSISDLQRAAHKAVREGQLRDAHQLCLAILKRDQDFADAWFLCGVIAAHNGQVKKSVEIFRKAIVLAPGNAEYLAELGKQYIALRETQQALRAAQEAMALKPTSVPVLNTLGTVFSHCGEHQTALACFELAARGLKSRTSAADALSPAWKADLYFNLGASLQFAGRFQNAEEAYEQAIALQPKLYKAHSALSLLRPQTPECNHLSRLNSLRGSTTSSHDQLHVGHAIAKEQEDLGLYTESLATLAWAKQAHARQVAYCAESDASLFAAIRQIFNADFFSARMPACNNAEPIFIVGMPRTGTTLVEQLLASHSQVHAAGELQNFPLLVKRMTNTPSADVVEVETFQRSSSLDAAVLGDAYIQSTRPGTGHTAHFVDKLPLNFLYLGLIRRALPNAKLVCLRRDPMDTCLSNYRQLFAVNFKHYYYNNDLLDCGRYYIEFDRLMQHWRDVMPGAVHEVWYEQLVEQPEPVCRALLQFCDLPWEDQCLSFHQRTTSVATPSAVQVRQGIYTSSVDRWRRYGAAMQPLYALLQSAGLYD